MPAITRVRTSLATLCGAGAALVAAAPDARAHCVQPEVIRPMFRAAAPDEIQLSMNFGNALSLDAGKTWQLQCEEVYLKMGEMIGPNNVWMAPDGKLVLAHFYGLLTTSDRGCKYDFATGLPKDMDGKDLPAIDAVLDSGDPTNKIWLLVEDTLYRSTDGGKSVSLVRKFDGHSLLRIVNSPTDPKVLYIVSFTSDDAGLRMYVSYTLDGTAWKTELSPFGKDEIRLEFVSPSDPKRIYAVRDVMNQSLHALDFDTTGVKTTMLFSVSNPKIMDFDRRIFASLGAATGELWVAVQGDDGSADGGELHHSTDDGKMWAKVAAAQPHFRCLRYEGGKLWGCGNNLSAMGDAFAFGVSADGGKSWTKKFAFGELCDALACISATCKPIFESACVPGLCGPTGGPEPADGGVDGPTPDVPKDAAADKPVDLGGNPDAPAADGKAGGGGGGICAASPGNPPTTTATSASALAVICTLIAALKWRGRGRRRDRTLDPSSSYRRRTRP